MNGEILARKLFAIMGKQQKYYYRNVAGEKVITNNEMYHVLENDLYLISREISADNKRKIAKGKRRG